MGVGPILCRKLVSGEKQTLRREKIGPISRCVIQFFALLLYIFPLSKSNFIKMGSKFFIVLTIITTVAIFLPISISQSQNNQSSSNACNYIFVTYQYTEGEQIAPNLTGSDPTHQPYSFKSTLTVANNGLDELKSWMVFVGFQHGELLVSASNAVLADGTSLPANVSNGTIFSGYPNADLKTAVETAGDSSQTTAKIELVGTQFGVKPLAVPLPNNLTLANDGYSCPSPTNQGNDTLTMCCKKDPDAKSNVTNVEKFLPRRHGDVTIMYDVTQASESDYWAQVSITNENPLGRLDYWKLSWQWMREEFIYAMQGAYPSVVDVSECIFGSQFQYYKEFDFSSALSCSPTPTIVDLPVALTNDTKLGLVPHCCRNGTLLPSLMDPSKSKAAFKMHVYKMPPDLNVSELYPPQNWNIKGSFPGQDFQCSPPVRVSPSRLPNPNGLPSDVGAIASWQVVCNKTKPKGQSPVCCVSYSSYYAESVIPCSTCACGCSNGSKLSRTCNATAQALPLPANALLIPFENRTKIALAYAQLHHIPIPRPLPCGDNCGVSINWHLLSDYRDGWTSRVTLFNWDDTTDISDWFLAVELDKAGLGLEKVYTLNGTTLPNDTNTIFMHGFKGYNDYLLAERSSSKPMKDPPTPGTLQSIVSFKKKQTPGINITGGDGYPIKVNFNGQECLLPTMLPGSSASIKSIGMFISFLLPLLVLLVVQM